MSQSKLPVEIWRELFAFHNRDDLLKFIMLSRDISPVISDVFMGNLRALANAPHVVKPNYLGVYAYPCWARLKMLMPKEERQTSYLEWNVKRNALYGIFSYAIDTDSRVCRQPPRNEAYTTKLGLQCEKVFEMLALEIPEGAVRDGWLRTSKEYLNLARVIYIGSRYP